MALTNCNLLPTSWRRDGVIEAKIDHEQGWVTSSEVLDLYGTEEPQRAFHK